MRSWTAVTALALAAAILFGADVRAQGAPAPREESGGFFSNMLKYGSPTVPPAAPPNIEDAYCPVIAIAEGGAAITSYSSGRVGDQAGLRNQIALAQLGRECTPLADGSVSVKVGIEGRALIGPSGAPGRFDAPVSVAIKHNETVVTSRVRRVSVTVPPGSAQGSFAFVEDNIVVPAAMARDFEIEVAIGGSGAKTAKPARRKPRAQSEHQG